ncbi:MAG: hypothetical protein HQK83_05770 [Fibrobacteria bacterium]|nr:hypothetical protein [Fibrobacteria bacterium]
MINFSKKAADRFKVKWSGLPEQQGDFWKIDIVMVGRFPILLIIHEYTLFTLVRMKKDFKNLKQVIEEIRCCCPWYRYVGQCVIGKNGDRRLSGSINEIKKRTWYMEGFPEDLPGLEQSINTSLFSSLSPKKNDYGTPFETMALYKQGQWPVSK